MTERCQACGEVPDDDDDLAYDPGFGGYICGVCEVNFIEEGKY